MNVERLIEIGPSPTLAGMAQRTLKTKYEGYDQALGMQRQVLAYSKEGKEIYYNVDPPIVDEVAPVESVPAPAAATPAPAAAPAPVAAPSGPVAQIADEPVKALDIVHTVVAQKLKKTLEEVSPGKAIKDLVGGKSTLQVYLVIYGYPNGRTKFLVICRKSSADYPSTPLKMSQSMNWVQQFNLPSEERSVNLLQG